MLDDYNGRLSEELLQRREVARMLRAYIVMQKESLSEAEKKLQVSYKTLEICVLLWCFVSNICLAYTLEEITQFCRIISVINMVASYLKKSPLMREYPSYATARDSRVISLVQILRF